MHVATERGWRGGERQVLLLAESLERAGYRNLIAARPGEPLAQRAQAYGITVVPIVPGSEFDPGAILSLRRAVAKYGVDVVHAHTAHAVTLAALAVLRTRASMALTRRVDFRLRQHAASRWKYRRADAIIAISEAVAAVMIDGGIPPERIDIIPDGIDLTRIIEPASPATLGALGIPGGAPLVVKIAALVHHKDPLTFVRAIAVARQTVPDLRALLVGKGPLRSEVEAERDRLGLEGVLQVTGFRADADELLAAAHVASLSSQEEGMGSVLLDACMLGRPIAATAAGGIPEVIQDGISGLLSPPGDADALGAAIARLLTDSVLAARCAAGALARARDFSIDRTAALTAAVYERVRARPIASVS